ncbi:MAG: hypothetical protein ABSF59_08040 [Candidatus Sulfotelmatobacter sp.]|jgi:hypothetical protein
MATPVKQAAWLEWIAGLVGAGSRQTQTASLLPGQFHCLLDELPLHLIPQPALGEQVSSENWLRLFFNPQCSVLPAGQVPAELEANRDLLSAFNWQLPIAWVRDPATSFLQPFWLGPQLEAVVSQLRSGECAPASLSPAARRVLTGAGILTSENAAEVCLSARSRVLQRSSALFRDQEYALLRNLIHPFHIAVLRRYYRHAIRRGIIPLGDHQSSRRYVAHNEPVARFFHHQIASTVAAVVGEAVKPSYVYLASYLSGAELKKHTDRKQCEFSVTLCLDFSPEPTLATSWPIRLETAEGRVTVFQALGDGLVYRGTTVPHYRDALPAGHTSTSIFFHYVRADFCGPLD